MASDNTLGAPTEGLGQTVTFAVGGGGGVPQQQPVARQGLRAQAQGGQAVRTSQALMVPEAKPDATFSALMKLGGDILKPHIERERNVMFMQGVQKAASQQAINEIVDEQPWYSKLFGPTSLVDGARAYTASKKATDFAIDVESNIQQYRAMSEQDFTKVMAERMQQMMTGDAATDALATQQIAQHMPGVFKGVAKERVRFAQEQFVAGRTGAIRSILARAGVADANARNPERATENVDALETMALATSLLVRPDGVDKKVDDGIIGGAVIEALGKGNFAAYTWFADSQKLQELEPEIAYRVNRANEQAQREARVKLPPEFSALLAEYKHMPAQAGTTEEAVMEKAAAINAQYTKATGDPSPLVTTSSLTGELLQLKQVTDHRAAQVARANESVVKAMSKEEAKQAALSELASRMQSDVRFTPVSLSKAEIQGGFNEVRRVANGDEKPVLSAVAKMWVHGAIDKVTADNIESTAKLGLAGQPGQLHNAYKQWLGVYNAVGGDWAGRVAAAEYSGSVAKQLARYHDYASGLNRELSEADMAIAANIAMQPEVKDASKNVAKATAEHYATSDLAALFYATGRVLNESDKVPVKDTAGLAAMVAGYVDPSLPTKDGVAAAERKLRLNVIGGHYWPTPPAATKYTDWLTVHTNLAPGHVDNTNVNRAMKHAVGVFSSEVGIDGEAKVLQVSDTANKEPQFMVMGMRTNGEATRRVFTASEINKVWKDSGSGELLKTKAALDVQRREAISTAFDAVTDWFTDTSRLPVTRPGEPFGPSAYTK